MKHSLKIFLLSMSIILLIIGCAKQEEEPAIIVDSAISADGNAIHYQVQGQGKPALIFIHGWCCDRSYWDAQLPYFAQKYKVVAIDLVGHGESGLNRKEWTMGAFGEDVVAVVNKLNLDQVMLVGHSMGGPVILEAARRMPQRAIGLVGVDIFWDFEDKYTQEFLDEFLTRTNDNFVEFMKNFVRPMFTSNSDSVLIDKIVIDMSSAPPEVGIGAAEAIFDFQNNKIIQVLREVKAPITCINADMYQTNVETNQRYAPSFKAKIMSGVGHFNMMEDPETFNRLLEETVQEFVQMAKSN